MKKTFALLAVTTALSAALAVPALADRMNDANSKILITRIHRNGQT